jgi:dihydroorotate dehydrogenase/NAD-dependent dihydropyrimidine dehydrogenase PreA subunit
MVSLCVNFADIEMKNPIVVASSPATENLQNILGCWKAGAGAVITKSIADYDPDSFALGARRTFMDSQGMWAASTFRRETLSLKEGTSLVRKATEITDIPVIASVTGIGTEIDSWYSACLGVEKAGAHMIQLDLFYLPQPVCSSSTAAALRDLIDHLAANLSVPVMPKLNVEIPANFAADLFKDLSIGGIAYLDSVRVPSPIFVKRGGALAYRFISRPSASSLFGSWQKPLTLHYTDVLRKLTSFPLCAGGGLVSAHDILETIMLGATTVQLASTILLHGFKRINELVLNLTHLLEEQGYEDVNELRGKAHQHFGSQDETRFVKAKVAIDETLCNACGRCLDVVFCNAIKSEGGMIRISEDACEGCGLCTFICERGALILNEA